jgi:hypothetical protein
MSRTKSNPVEPAAGVLPPRPGNRAELWAWCRDVLGLRIPDRSVCPHHQSPMDFLEASFLGDSAAGHGHGGASDSGPPAGGPGGDLLVWANRGGGKTMLAAAASLLDGLYKAPIALRVLGGSFDQSDRLAEHLRDMLSGPLGELVQGRLTRHRIQLVGGADIRMLAQSQRAVRGQHVQKIRCDEVDLFDAEIWRALQFVTRSSQRARGGVEVFSTLHRTGGLMDRLVHEAQGLSEPHKGGCGFRLIHWCLWEVIQRCPPQRPCKGCPLLVDCGGLARSADGFFRIDDAIAIMQRSSRAAWEAEMLCRGAQRDWLVFGEFDPAVHVAKLEYRPEWSVYRAIDFGYTNPLVCLWIQLSPAGMVHVLREYAVSQRSLEQHAQEIASRDLGEPKLAFVDPAGTAKESNGLACTELLGMRGIRCVSKPSAIADGLELIRAALAPAAGEVQDSQAGPPAPKPRRSRGGGETQPRNRNGHAKSRLTMPPEAGLATPLQPRQRLKPRLLISRDCPQLIRAFQTYHYPAPGQKGDPDKPVKDGPDHFIDALRYFFVNCLWPRQGVERGRY